MKTPIYKHAIRTYFPKLERHCSDRMDRGAIEYGDKSFTNSVMKSFTEIQEELEDTRNWAAIAWVKLEKLKELLTGVEQLITEPCKKHPKYNVESPPKVLCEYCWYVYIVKKIQRDILQLNGEENVKG